MLQTVLPYIRIGDIDPDTLFSPASFCRLRWEGRCERRAFSKRFACVISALSIAFVSNISPSPPRFLYSSISFSKMKSAGWTKIFRTCFSARKLLSVTANHLSPPQIADASKYENPHKQWVCAKSRNGLKKIFAGLLFVSRKPKSAVRAEAKTSVLTAHIIFSRQTKCVAFFLRVLTNTA